MLVKSLTAVLVTPQDSTPGHSSTPTQARMAGSQDPPWHGMRGMTRITSEFKVTSVNSKTMSLLPGKQSSTQHLQHLAGHGMFNCSMFLEIAVSDQESQAW